MEQTRISGNLTLNLSLPLLSTSLEQPVYTRQDPANQLTDHLASQLATNLTCRGPLNTLLTGHLNSSLATEDRPVITQALQMVAAKFAGELVDRFPDMLAKQMAITNGTTQRSAPPPQTSKDYSFYLNRFIENNLTKFYKRDDHLVKDLAERAADQARAVTKEYRLQPEETAGLAKLALYDFVILCGKPPLRSLLDESMSEDNRMPALKDTLERVATFATILSTDGISIRLLNYNKDGDGDFDHLKTVKSVARKLEKIQCSGDTKLGTILEKKIVKPMILDKATAGTLKKPIIIVIITDGEPVGEEDERLRDTIRGCKNSMKLLGYKNAAAVFLISRVGSSEEAKEFLNALRKDEEVGHMVYSSKEDLNEKWEAFRAGGDNAAYTAWLLKLFLAALEKVEY